MSLLYQLGYVLKHQIRLSCVSQPDKHVVQSIHKFYITMNQLHLSNIVLILSYQ